MECEANYQTMLESTKYYSLIINFVDRPDTPVRYTRSVGSWRTGHCYYCPLCNYCVLFSQHECNLHMRRTHPHKPPLTLHPCKECGYVTDSTHDIEQHHSLHSHENTVQCADCMFLCVKSSVLKQHHAVCAAVRGSDYSQKQKTGTEGKGDYSTTALAPPAKLSAHSNAHKIDGPTKQRTRSGNVSESSSTLTDASAEGTRRSSRRIKDMTPKPDTDETARSGMPLINSEPSNTADLSTTDNESLESTKQEVMRTVVKSSGSKKRRRVEKLQVKESGDDSTGGQVEPTAPQGTVQSPSSVSLVSEETPARVRRSSGISTVSDDTRVRRSSSRARAAAAESDTMSVKSEASSVRPASEVSSRPSSPERGRRVSGRVKSKQSYVESISDPENIEDTYVPEVEGEDVRSEKSYGSVTKKKVSRKRSKPDNEAWKPPVPKRVNTGNSHSLDANLVVNRTIKVKTEKSTPQRPRQPSAQQDPVLEQKMAEYRSQEKEKESQAREQKMKDFFSDSDDDADSNSQVRTWSTQTPLALLPPTPV